MPVGVLIVDDEEDIRLLIRTLIDAVNGGLHVVGEAATGVDAVGCVDELDPAVVLLDQRMPGLTGIETAIRILERRPDQRIILCSAYLDDETRRLAEEVGIRVCLTKRQVSEIPARVLAVAEAS